MAPGDVTSTTAGQPSQQNTGNTLGSLDLLATGPAAFDDESERVGLLISAHAAVALADAQELEGVQSALLTRDVIGQTEGILILPVLTAGRPVDRGMSPSVRGVRWARRR